MCNAAGGGGFLLFFFFFFSKKFQFVEADAAYRKWLFLADNKPDYLPRLLFFFFFKFQIKSLL